MGAVPAGRGTEYTARAARKSLAGDGVHHWCGPGDKRDGVSRLDRGRCSKSTRGGRQPPMVRLTGSADKTSRLGAAHRVKSACGGWQSSMAGPYRLGGRGVVPKWCPLPGQRLRGAKAHIGAVPPAGGTWCPALVMLNEWRPPEHGGMPHWRGTTSWADSVSRPGGGGCLESGCSGRQPP